ncbi:hypothetical protein, partial [Desulfobaculum sp.]
KEMKKKRKQNATTLLPLTVVHTSFARLHVPSVQNMFIHLKYNALLRTNRNTPPPPHPHACRGRVARVCLLVTVLALYVSLYEELPDG